jgi:processing peptidase subunit beta
MAQAVSAGELASSFSSFNTTYTDTGLFGMYLISPHREKLIDLSETALKHWRSICTSASDAEVQRAKNQLKTAMLFSLDSSVNIAEEIGRHMLTYGRRLSPYEIDRMIEAVDTNVIPIHDYHFIIMFRLFVTLPCGTCTMPTRRLLPWAPLKPGRTM